VVDGTVPDLTVVLDIDVEEGLRRAAERSAAFDRYERLDPAFHRRIRQGFLDIARSDPGRCVLVDAGAAPESVQAAIRRAVRERLGVAL